MTDVSPPPPADEPLRPSGSRRTGRRTRDRHGRGLRGPALGDTPLAPRGVPARRAPAERFDDIALRVMRAVVAPWADQLGDLDLAVEEVPVLPKNWAGTSVPLASYAERTADTGPRLVLFRRPLEHRAESTVELETLVLTVIVEQVAEILGIAAQDVHPGYEEED
ncbi:MAG: hypothetical protein JWQ74_1222 [Marmoricola sp.]|nr:hypothetical protein [Marmoricola sp.]